MSLVPGATEMLLVLNVPVMLVGRSRECDQPVEARKAPVLTRSPTVSGSSAQIDAAVGAGGAGAALARRLGTRVESCREAAERLEPMRVVCLEWLSSVYCAGHWIPDQVEAAGGRELLGEADQPARPIEADRIADAGPRLVVLAPCGWGARETTQRGEKEGVRDALLGADDPPWVWPQMPTRTSAVQAPASWAASSGCRS